MIICVKCGKIMTCKKTGATVRFQNNWARSADIFECPCGSLVAKCSADGYDDTNKKKEDIYINE